MPAQPQMWRKRNDIDLPPDEVAARLAPLGGLAYFDTSTADFMTAPEAVSVVAANPVKIVRGHISDASARLALRNELASLRESGAVPEEDTGLPAGGAFGTINYDGKFEFGIYDRALVYRHGSDEWLQPGDDIPDVDCLLECEPSPEQQHAKHAPEFQPGIDRVRYCDLVSTAKDYIAAGDIYQVNIAQRFDATWPDGADALAFYRHLRNASPAPHSAFLSVGSRDVLSTSPECFLRMSGRLIETRPIKGTRPRFRDPAADEQSAYDLITSQKEIAELVMITDLERNDLGQVCEYGSVTVSELLKLERFAHVFHLVSTINGRLRHDVDHIDALARCFPGGSVTGAPKKRAMEIIAELEPVNRGLFTGAVGYLGVNGESQFSIAIRTAVIENGRIHFHVGSGIVADSDPDREYDETLHKAAGILAAANTYPAESTRVTSR